MKIAIMQPYFFPYIGQFQLIYAADRFILCDDVPYIRHGWINRNRILKPEEGIYYITVPLAKHKSNTPIRDIKTAACSEWKLKILRQMEHYKKRSPYYSNVSELVNNCLDSTETSIAKLNGNCLKAVCDYIGIRFQVEISSEMDFDYSNVTLSDEWAIRMCEQLGATEYLNPPGGMELYDASKFRNSNISLRFLKANIKAYDQRRQNFEPALSIIDIMMFNSPEEIKLMLSDYQML